MSQQVCFLQRRIEKALQGRGVMSVRKRKATPSDLLYVSKASKERIDTLSAGASLVSRTGYEVKQLRIKAAEDRVELARTFLQDAATLGTKGGLYRTVVSRAYYAMYHSLRAATFVAYGGDDHEQHTVLPSKLPTDFPEMPKL